MKNYAKSYQRLLESQFEFILYGEDQSVVIKGDQDRLQQVLGNVIDNAINNTPKDNRRIVLKGERRYHYKIESYKKKIEKKDFLPCL